MHVTGASAPRAPGGGRLDEADRRLVLETQAGLPLEPRPWHALGRRLGMSAAEVMERIARLQASGVIRRIGAVPNHYALGYGANGMSVWDVADEAATAAGREIGELPFVSHCYLRPRHLPDWPYNLFAMVHGHDRESVARHVTEIAARLGTRQRGHDVLYSTRILKKTGLRLDDGAPRATASAAAPVATPGS